MTCRQININIDFFLSLTVYTYTYSVSFFCAFVSFLNKVMLQCLNYTDLALGSHFPTLEGAVFKTFSTLDATSCAMEESS